MRLVCTEDLTVEEFSGRAIPFSAILPHRWRLEEITLQDLERRANPGKRGWAKLCQFRDFARNRGHQYIWLDTCCIDKTNNTELSEAINSMYQWYAGASVCYAYLYDVPSTRDLSSEDWSRIFHSSGIWSRGWTLQELLAPGKVVFVCSDWSEVIGTKDSLSPEISKATSIPEAIVKFYPGCTLTGPGYSNAATVADVMSWASFRVCTRIEDSAYSLMGLFGIPMPLLYGEGGNAFLRVQLEIISRTDDESIFVWSGVDEMTGLLAPFLSNFQRSSKKTFLMTEWDAQRPPYAMTKKGLRFEPLLCRYEGPVHSMVEKWVMPLNVDVVSSSSAGPNVLTDPAQWATGRSQEPVQESDIEDTGEESGSHSATDGAAEKLTDVEDDGAEEVDQDSSAASEESQGGSVDGDASECENEQVASSKVFRTGLAVLLTFRANGITASRNSWYDLIEHNYTSDDKRFERRTIFIQQSWAPWV